MSMTLMAKAMSIKVGNPLRKLVLIKLADNANDKGECWPSYQHIADHCECSKSAVRSHIDALIEMGFLIKENRLGVNNGKGNTSNIYYLDLSCPVPPESIAPMLSKSIAMPKGGSPMPSKSTPPMPSESTRTSHSFEPVKEPVNESTIGASADASAPARSARQEYSPEFEQAWQEYPKRAGGNSKSAAFKAWKARIREGIKPETMLDGVKRYAAWVRATGNTGTQFVKQAATFFGPDRHFEESWQQPAAPGGGRTIGLPLSGFSEQDYGSTNFNW